MHSLLLHVICRATIVLLALGAEGCPLLSLQILESIAIPVNMDDREQLLKAATT